MREKIKKFLQCGKNIADALIKAVVFGKHFVGSCVRSLALHINRKTGTYHQRAEPEEIQNLSPFRLRK